MDLARAKDCNIPVKMASASFFRVITSPGFWRCYPWFAVLSLIGIAALPFLFEWTIPDSPLSSLKDNAIILSITMLLAMVILSLAILSLLVSARLLADIYRDRALARDIENRGLADLGKMESGGASGRRSIDEFKNYLPKDVPGKGRVLELIFDEIYQDTQDAVFTSAAPIMRPHKERLREKLGPLSGIQTIALRLGILGTFVGLIMGIVDVGSAFFATSGIAEISTGDVRETVIDMLTARQEEFAEISNQLFTALHIAFGTSIAGLGVSILTLMLLLYLRGCQEKLFRNIDEATNVILRLLRNARNESGLVSSFAQMKTTIDDLRRRVQGDFDDAAKLNKELYGEIAKQVEVTKDGLEGLRELKVEWQGFSDSLETTHESVLRDMAAATESSRSQFGGFLQDLNDGQKQFLNDAKSTLELLSVGKLGESIDTSIRSAGTGIAGTLGGEVHDALERLEKHSQKVTALAEANNALSRQLAEFSSTVIGAQTNLQTAIESLHPTASHLGDLNTALPSLGQKIEKLDSATRKMTARIPHPIILYIPMGVGLLLTLKLVLLIVILYLL